MGKRSEDKEAEAHAITVKYALEIYNFCKEKPKLKKHALELSRLSIEPDDLRKMWRWYKDEHKKATGQKFLDFVERKLENRDINRRISGLI